MRFIETKSNPVRSFLVFQTANELVIFEIKKHGSKKLFKQQICY